MDNADSDPVAKKASMDWWNPKLQGMDIPRPETISVPIRSWDEATEFTEGVPMSAINIGDVQSLISELDGPPVFVRTDQSSAKHRMEKASKITSTDPDDIEKTIFELLQSNEMKGFAGLPYMTLKLREWLDLKHEFTAFGSGYDGVPIASEIRVFIDDGDVYDHGFYWPADAIEDGRHDSLPDNWRDQLESVRTHALGQSDTVLEMADTVADRFKDYWSVDFAETTDGDWYLLDMAPGEASWHPESVDPPEHVDRGD